METLNRSSVVVLHSAESCSLLVFISHRIVGVCVTSRPVTRSGTVTCRYDFLVFLYHNVDEDDVALSLSTFLSSSSKAYWKSDGILWTDTKYGSSNAGTGIHKPSSNRSRLES